MPTQMTFDSLVQDLQRYLERGTALDEIVFEQLPSLINLAERQVSKDLNGMLGFIVPANFTMQAGLSVYPKPDRWRRTISMNVGTAPAGIIKRRQMFERSYEYVRSFWPDDSATNLSVYGSANPPQFYCDYNYQNILVAPTPDQAYPAEIVYQEEPALLDATNQTNFLTQYLPNALLFASLVQCTPFLKNDARIATWKQMYDMYCGVAKAESDSAVADRNTTRQQA